ncbi:hypothetical protein N7513_005276 [Penicillium frequentans]|nr:hypothetical protein N7513_005276 [Penicillium glabrum]
MEAFTLCYTRAYSPSDPANLEILPGESNCKFFQQGKPTICSIAEGNTEDLHKYIETGWQHFIQHRREKDLSIPKETTPCLQDAKDLHIWSDTRQNFLTQMNCIHSPSFAICRFEDPGCESPLINAIRVQSTDNISLLLTLGANPDGYPLSWFEIWQTFFLRFGVNYSATYYVPSRAKQLDRIEVDTAQTDCITEGEVEKRSRNYFWRGSADSWRRNRGTEVVHPLVMAASLSSTRVVDQLLNTNADRSFWIVFPALKAIPEQPTPSSLSLSSPLHEAIVSGNTEMLTHLLQAGFNPNVLPLGDVYNSITPLMATILDGHSWNEPAYEILARHPRIDFNVRTPYLLIHILHVAAGHSLYALQRVERDIPLATAGATAYGHTLLHIACMPLEIQNLASKTRESIRNIRCPRQRQRNGKGFFTGLPISFEQCESEFPEQMELIQYLLDQGLSVMAYDSDLNTPLHYLAGARVVNEGAIALLRQQVGGEDAWCRWGNWYGYTAEEIWEQNLRIQVKKDIWYGGTTKKVVTMPKLRM